MAVATKTQEMFPSQRTARIQISLVLAHEASTAFISYHIMKNDSKIHLPVSSSSATARKQKVSVGKSAHCYPIACRSLKMPNPTSRSLTMIRDNSRQPMDGDFSPILQYL